MNNHYASLSPNELPLVRRHARSKGACLTCRLEILCFHNSNVIMTLHRRRKVRCNEQRPRCSHCERLNLECNWRPTPNSQHLPRRNSSKDEQLHQNNVVFQGTPGSSSAAPAAPLQNQPHGHLDGSFLDAFSYASFMWDEYDGMSSAVPRWGRVVSPRMGENSGEGIIPVSSFSHSLKRINPYSSERYRGRILLRCHHGGRITRKQAQYIPGFQI